MRSSQRNSPSSVPIHRSPSGSYNRLMQFSMPFPSLFRASNRVRLSSRGSKSMRASVHPSQMRIPSEWGRMTSMLRCSPENDEPKTSKR